MPKALLTALNLKCGSRLEIELTPKKDAIIVKAASHSNRVRGRHKIEDLAAAMPKNYKTAEFDFKAEGREVW